MIGGQVHPSVYVAQSRKILAVYNNSSGGGKELLLDTSTDGGNTWSEPRRVKKLGRTF